LCGGAVVDADGESWPYCVDCGWQQSDPEESDE
jgi:hypothetical protein